MKTSLIFIMLILSTNVIAQEIICVKRIPVSKSWGEKIIYEWMVEEKSKFSAVFTLRNDQTWILKVQSSPEIKAVAFINSKTMAMIIDQSWVRFKREKPSANLKTIGFDVSLCKDIWDEIEYKLKDGITKFKGEIKPKSKNLNELFLSSLLSVENIGDIKEIPEKHGKSIWYLGPWDMVIIEDSFWGKPWSKMVEAPYAGLKRPIIVGINLK